jgi:hypothetical protein
MRNWRICCSRYLGDMRILGGGGGVNTIYMILSFFLYDFACDILVR